MKNGKHIFRECFSRPWAVNNEVEDYILGLEKKLQATSDSTAIIDALEFYAKWVKAGEYRDIKNDVTVYICPAPLTIDGGEKAEQALKILKSRA